MTDQPSPTPVPAASERMTAEQMRGLINIADGQPWLDCSKTEAAHAIRDLLALVDKQSEELASLREAGGNDSAHREIARLWSALVKAREDCITLSARAEAAEARAERARATAIDEALQAIDAEASKSGSTLISAGIRICEEAIRALLTAPPPTAKEAK